MLEVARLAVHYGKAQIALQDVTLTVPDGAAVAVLGANGAGKSTLMRALSGTLGHHRGTVDEGTITYGGRSLRGLDAAGIVAAGVVQVPEGRRIFTTLTVEENLRAGAVLVRDRATRTRRRDEVYALFPVLAERREQRAGLLSGGEQQMLAIGRALMSGPSLLLLDEPSLGLAPRIVARIGEIVREINRQGTAVLLVEQNAAMALSVADTAYVFEVGRVRLSGPSARLRESDEIRRLYLGGDAGPQQPGPEQDGPAGPGERALARWSR
ncbi:ABC transporter ATP-binding protein [Streptomyces geranii]|uniref:ABC transporter ATP-binding protein n=1 Tax=Streptomyces geranii TaxID=2058923 RepID=UPI000D02C557|nr:ABC transporter ATP-binding protein [Streptomyces geranii]